MLACTQKRMALVNRAFQRQFGFCITPEIAKQLIQWDDEDYFVRELTDDGELDTSPRDYLAMAAIAALMPGRPPVVDGLVGRRSDWHWPLNGSSTAYVTAFAGQWLRAENLTNWKTKAQHKWPSEMPKKGYQPKCEACGVYRLYSNDLGLCPAYKVKRKKKSQPTGVNHGRRKTPVRGTPD